MASEIYFTLSKTLAGGKSIFRGGAAVRPAAHLKIENIVGEIIQEVSMFAAYDHCDYSRKKNTIMQNQGTKQESFCATRKQSS